MSGIKRTSIHSTFVYSCQFFIGRITFGNSKKMSFAYPSDMRHFLLLSTRLFPIRSLSEICGVRLTEWDFHPHFKIIR